VPLVALILFFALYPQLALHKGEPSIAKAVAPAAAIQHNEDLISDARTHDITVIK
jgi:NADH-quinone oxidoreductase subunit M